MRLLRDQVYKENHPTIHWLKENIKREINRIPADMLKRAIDNFNVSVAGVFEQLESNILSIIRDL